MDPRHAQTDSSSDEARALLADGDAAIGARWLSLAPDREHARRLQELTVDTLLVSDLRIAVARGVTAIAGAVHRNFPHNLFCDLDVVATALERGAARHGRPWVESTAATIVELHDIFGCSTAIQFRYVHDFLYGFDWARWVRRDPSARASVGPFDAAFLEYARRRGTELTSLISKDDPKYNQLPQGADRNPFPFARDPESERALLRDLAQRGWIPVEAWSPEAAPQWDRDFSAERERRARELGIAR